MANQNNIDVVKNAYQNFQQGNIEGVLQNIDDNISWDSPQVGNINFTGKKSGKREVQDFFSQLGQQIEFTNFEPQEFIEQNGKVIVLGRSAGSVGATGKSMDDEWVHVFEVSNGKIKSFKEYSDTYALSEAFKWATVYFDHTVSRWIIDSMSQWEKNCGSWRSITDLRKWPTDPDLNKNFSTIVIPVKKTENTNEKFTIEITETKKGGLLKFLWDDVMAYTEFEVIKN